MKIYQEMPQSTVPSTLAHNLKNPYQKKQHKQKKQATGYQRIGSTRRTTEQVGCERMKDDSS